MRLVDADKLIELLTDLSENYTTEGREYHPHIDFVINTVRALAKEQSLSCNGCVHQGNWEDTLEYGYPCPCNGCRRKYHPDNYKRMEIETNEEISERFNLIRTAIDEIHMLEELLQRVSEAEESKNGRKK